MNSCLAHTSNFFNVPKPACNPYTNLPFLVSNLYAFYFFIKSDGRFPSLPLVDPFFRCGFQLDRFLEVHQTPLRDYTLSRFVKNGSVTELLPYVRQMLNDVAVPYLPVPGGVGAGAVRVTTKIKVHAEFPKDRLVAIFRPYVDLFLKSMYSTDDDLCESYSRQLKKRLAAFHLANTSFGRVRHVQRLRNNKSTTGSSSSSSSSSRSSQIWKVEDNIFSFHDDDDEQQSSGSSKFTFAPDLHAYEVVYDRVFNDTHVSFDATAQDQQQQGTASSSSISSNTHFFFDMDGTDDFRRQERVL